MTDFSGLTLPYDMEILPVNGEEGNVRSDCVRYAHACRDKLTIATGAGDIYEGTLMNHAAVVAGGCAPGNFGFSLHDRDAETLDELLVGKPTPARTDTACVYFTGTRWSCPSAEAIAFCNLETRLRNNISAPEAPSSEQSMWWQDEPNFCHCLLVNNGGAGIQQAGAIDAADTGSRLCSTLLPDPASRRRPCASLWLHLHQVVKGTFSLKPWNTPGTQNEGRGRVAPPCGSCRLCAGGQNS